MSAKNTIIKDFAGFTNREITPKTIRTQKVTTKRLCVTENAEIQNLDVDSVNVSQLNLNGQFNSTSTSVFDFNGLIKINQANYVLTVTQLEQALADAAVTGGSSIILAPGTFFISETLVVPANTDIIGSGPNTTIIKARDGFTSSPGSMMYIAGGNNAIQNLQLDGNNGSSRLIDITGCSNVGIQNLELKKTSGAFVTLRNSSSNVNVNNINCATKTDSQEPVFQINSGSNDSSFSNITIDTVTQTYVSLVGYTVGSSIFRIIDTDPNDASATVGNTNGITVSNVLIKNVNTEISLFEVGELSTGVISSLSFFDISILDSTIGFTLFNIAGSTTNLISDITIDKVQLLDSVLDGSILNAGTFFSFINIENATLNNFKTNATKTAISGSGATIRADTLTVNNIFINDVNFSLGNIFNGFGVSIQTTSSGGIRNTFITNSFISNYARGITTEGTITNVSNLNFINLTIEKSADSSILLTDISDLTIDNCKINDPQRSGGFDITDCIDVNIKNSTFTDSSNTAVSNNTLNDTSGCQGLVIQNCIFQGETTVRDNVLRSQLDSNVTIQSCIFSGNATNKLVNIEQTTELVMFGNKLNGSGGEGLDLTSSNSIVVFDNITNTLSNGITLTDCVKANVHDNNIRDSTLNGIYIDGMEGSLHSNILYDSNNNINLATNSDVIILDNKATSNVSSNITVNPYDSIINANASVSTVFITLPDVISRSSGHKIRFETTDTGNVYITPSSPGNDLISLSSYTSNIHLNVASSFATVEWSGSAWNVLGGSSTGLTIT